MKIIRACIGAAFMCLLVLLLTPRTQPTVVLAQTHAPVTITRLFTGPDGQTHSDETEADFSGQGGLFKLMPVNGAEIRRASPGGGPATWHTGPQRQYVITLKGHGELEIADGKKIAVGPGDIELIEDTTGRGHITRVTGTDDRIILLLQLVDQSGK